MGHIVVGVLMDSLVSIGGQRWDLLWLKVSSLAPHLWNTADLGECHPEYPGSYLGGGLIALSSGFRT